MINFLSINTNKLHHSNEMKEIMALDENQPYNNLNRTDFISWTYVNKVSMDDFENFK